MEENVLQHETVAQAEEDYKAQAAKKLNGELKEAKDKKFAEPVIGYLLKRCDEDKGLAEDVMQEHKTWEKCYSYIYDQARKQQKNNRAVVRDDTVYEWAEDYYHKDDRKEEAEKAERQKKQEEIRKKSEEQRKAREAKAKKSGKASNANQKAAKSDKKAANADQKPEDVAQKPKAEPQRSKREPKEIEGQMDLFSMMGL
ncbi:MAG: PcfK-like family protein [Lachnospiraceae bacterium]|nr:PcfK-like family protein [Lachnospiraceae bacterium]